MSGLMEQPVLMVAMQAGVGLLFLFLAGRWAAVKLVEPLVKDHQALIAQLVSASRTHGEQMGRQTELLERLAERMDEHHDLAVAAIERIERREQASPQSTQRAQR